MNARKPGQESSSTEYDFIIIQAILEAAERKRQIGDPKMPILNINIPETLVLVDNCYQLIHSINGEVKTQEDVTIQDYLKIIKKNSPEGRNH